MTREELIIEMQPFSDGLKAWCRSHSDFTKALKIIYPERFITLQAVSTSYSPNYPKDEIIGVYAFDTRLKTQKFKQDFIINKGKRDDEFVLYTRYKGVNQSRCVKDINDFFTTYGKGGHYIQTHHVTLDQLPNELKSRAIRATELGNRLQKSGLRQLSEDDLIQMSTQLKALRDTGGMKPVIKLLP